MVVNRIHHNMETLKYTYLIYYDYGIIYYLYTDVIRKILSPHKNKISWLLHLYAIHVIQCLFIQKKQDPSRYRTSEEWSAYLTICV